MAEPALVPLLRPSGIPAPMGVNPAPPALSGLQRFAITAFAIIRIMRGFGFVAYPALSISSLDVQPTGNNTFVLGSLLGVRDLLLGGLLYTADESLEREVRRALVVNLLSDAFDTFILIFSTACSAHWQAHRIVAIAFVAVLALMEHFTLFSMGDDEELMARHAAAGQGGYGYQTMMLVDEDKKNRMTSWLAELRNAEEVRSVTPVPADHSVV
ncbi:hypothetical protein S7711_02768 [Stachybotrys chartarum IBT 7711]|uniref:Uncharacterized protein n=1 Tax=Stachybotrys chartarum (strain CBS 109288 / IBT 7711) TaxID=1280523 RepID=A0A084ALX7_STACB|nr:hypothetical protein S7711_02768 [Stachybotrys chartarum IBT 7711]KFA78723.1 hypothetical protein S40288_01652 [Stachybotrys chartarum IBT 40288]